MKTLLVNLGSVDWLCACRGRSGVSLKVVSRRAALAGCCVVPVGVVSQNSPLLTSLLLAHTGRGVLPPAEGQAPVLRYTRW